ncbi:MAG TPA: hypothetical protein VHB25_05850 [Gemmatimonadaceae bacterium]|nr:hypothetical protein [Gemmatimonadaceae bacterium]
MLRRILVLAATLASAAPLAAQSIGDIGARIAPQIHSYTIGAPTSETITEYALPLYVLLPVNPSLSFDLGTAYAQSRVEQTGTDGKKITSTISGMTDTQLRANYVIGTDFIVLTAGVNLPTGESTVLTKQQLAAGLIGSDFLAFPISNMGTGFGATGGVAIAEPVGDWSLGGGVSVRKSAAYDAFSDAGGARFHYQPGNEYRARVGLDRGVGTGRFTVGLTYSTFGNDNLAGSIYNTGNRWLTQLGFDNTYGPGQLTLTAWNLYRQAGTIADSSYLPHENIADAALSYGVTVGSAIVEPNIEARLWTPVGSARSSMGTIGLRSQMQFLGTTMLPSIGYSFGRLGAQDANGLNTTASLTGYHASLAIRLR